MNELDEVQAFFATQLRSRRSLPNDSAVSEQAARIVKPRGRLSPVERLEIYREQFWLRHTSALLEDFPGVSGILGQRAWASLVEGYLDTYPPRSFTLRDLGLQFPAYIESQTALEHHRLCCDMARLELGYIEIFDAADSFPIAPEVLAAIPEAAWERARLHLHPALRLLEVEYPVAMLRRKLIEAQSAAADVSFPAPEAHCLLLFRQNLQLFHEPISPGGHALLSALQRAIPLVAACQHAQAEVPKEAETIAKSIGTWFQSWAARGFIVDVEV